MFASDCVTKVWLRGVSITIGLSHSVGTSRGFLRLVAFPFVGWNVCVVEVAAGSPVPLILCIRQKPPHRSARCCFDPGTGLAPRLLPCMFAA